ncbi:MAG: flagellar hook-basal body protein [Vitreimonas sp.]
MTNAFEIAGVGLAAEQKALDIIANNITNLNTPAFKRADVQFSELVSQVSDVDNVRADFSAEPALAGVSARAALSLNQQGELEHTGRALDLAVNGNGFTELMGPNGQTLLWRGGALAVNGDGQLAASGGLPLKASISVPTAATNLTISANGEVSAQLPDNAGPTILGQIGLVRVDDPSSVERLDGGLYRVADDARLDGATPGEDGVGALVQGSIEHSNVAITDEMVRLMVVQRAFAASAQVVQAADQLMSIANNLRR